SVLDSACTTPHSSISFSPLGAAAGSTVSLTVCVRNTGNQAFYLESNPQSVSFTGLPLGVTGSFSLTPQQLAPGATNLISLTLTNMTENKANCEVMTTCGGSRTYETSLAQSYAIAGNCSSNSSCLRGGYTALFHPSEPNYIALVGGSNFVVTDDGNCCYEIDQPNLIDRLQEHGLMWSAYAEGATGSGTCSFMPPSKANHFGFLEFKDNNETQRCTHFLTT